MGALSGLPCRFWTAVVFASLGGFLFGFDLGVLSGVIDSDSFVYDFDHPSDFEKEMVVSVATLGAMCGAPAGGALADLHGRRFALIGSGMLFALGGAGMALAGSVTAFGAARFGSGIGIGVASSVVPMYLAEIAPVAGRGSVVAGYQIILCLGILVAYGVDSLFSQRAHGWRFPVGSMVAPGALMAAGMCVITEPSPRFF